MSRPAPRKSSLAGVSPLTPATEQPATPRPAKKPKPAAPKGEQLDSGKTPKSKVSFYQNPEHTARLRAAILHTMHTEGHQTLSDFIDRAAMREVERLEAAYNNGEPFPEVGPRGLPRGRPWSG